MHWQPGGLKGKVVEIRHHLQFACRLFATSIKKGPTVLFRFGVCNGKTLAESSLAINQRHDADSLICRSSMRTPNRKFTTG